MGLVQGADLVCGGRASVLSAGGGGASRGGRGGGGSGGC